MKVFPTSVVGHHHILNWFNFRFGFCRTLIGNSSYFMAGLWLSFYLVFMWKEAWATSMVSWNGALQGILRWGSQTPIFPVQEIFAILIHTLACFLPKKAHSWDFVLCKYFEGLVYNKNYCCYATTMSRSNIYWELANAGCGLPLKLAMLLMERGHRLEGSWKASFCKGLGPILSFLYPQYLPQYQHVESPWV